MKRTLPKYNLGGPGGRVLPYTGMTGSQEESQKKGTSASTAGGYAAAAGAIGNGLAGLGPQDPYTTKNGYAQGTDPTVRTVNSAVDTVVGAVPVVGQFYGAGKGISSAIKAGRDDARVNKDTSGASAAAFGAGFVDPAGSWGDIAQDEENGVISESEAWGGRALNLLLPGLGDAVLESERQSYFEGEARKNATSTNVGGTSGLDGRTYRRSNLVLARGGKMPQQANAELEGGEVVESPDGDMPVQGPSHAEGGVPMNLDPGDYVWSDQVRYKGKSMADWYKEFVKNGASEDQIEQLRALQESLAGREPGESGGQEMALGGNPGPGKPTRAGTFFKETLPNWFDQKFNGGRREAQRDMQSRASMPPAARRSDVRAEREQLSLTPDQKMAQDESLMNDAKVRQYQMAQGTAPQNNPAEAYNAQVTEGREQAAAAAQPDPYGKRPKADYLLSEYGPYALAGFGTIAQIAAAAGARNPYEGVTTPTAQQARTPENIHLTRVRDDAERISQERDFRAGLNQIERSGAGPGSFGAAQRLLNQKHQQASELSSQTARLNSEIDAREQTTNAGNRMQVDMFNAGQRQQAQGFNTELQIGKNQFEADRAQQIGSVLAGGARDAMAYMSDREYARSIYGNTGIKERSNQYSIMRAYNEIRKQNPNMPEAEVMKLVDEDSARYMKGK